MNLKINLMNQPLTHSFKPLSLGVLVVLSLAASLLSAATIDDLELSAPTTGSAASERFYRVRVEVKK